MKLNLQNFKAMEEKGIKVPHFDYAAVAAKTKKNPVWVHFGAGNIFRGFIANLQHKLLEEGNADTGIIAAETFDFDIIEKIYDPYDNLTFSPASMLMDPW